MEADQAYARIGIDLTASVIYISLMKRLGMRDSEKVVKRIRIINPADLPPGLILRPRVLAAIARELMSDIKKKGIKRIPPGVSIEWKKSNPARKFIGKLRRKK